MSDISIYELIKNNTMDDMNFRDDILMEYLRRKNKKREYFSPVLAREMASMGMNVKDLQMFKESECGVYERDYIYKEYLGEISAKLLFATKNIVTTVKNKDYQKNMELLEETFEDESIKVIYNYDKLKEEFKNISDEDVFEFFKYVVNNTQDVETLKYVLVMIEGRSIADEEIIAMVKRIALCLEFSYYCVKILKTVGCSNKDILGILNRIDCTKAKAIPVLTELDIENKENAMFILANAPEAFFSSKQKYIDMVNRMLKEDLGEQEMMKISNIFANIYLQGIYKADASKNLQNYFDLIINHIDYLIFNLDTIRKINTLVEKGVMHTSKREFLEARVIVDKFIKNPVVREKIVEYLHDENLINYEVLQQFIADFNFKEESLYLYSEYKKNPAKNFNLIKPLLAINMFKDDFIQMYFDSIEIEKYVDADDIDDDLYEQLFEFRDTLIREPIVGVKFADKLLTFKCEDVKYIGFSLYEFWTKYAHYGIKVKPESLKAIKSLVDSEDEIHSNGAKAFLGIEEDKKEKVLPKNLKIVKDNARNLLKWKFRDDNAVGADIADVAAKYLLEGYIEKFEMTETKVTSVIKDMINTNKYNVQIDIKENYDIVDQKCDCGKENCEHIIATILRARREYHQKNN